MRLRTGFLPPERPARPLIFPLPPAPSYHPALAIRRGFGYRVHINVAHPTRAILLAVFGLLLFAGVASADEPGLGGGLVGGALTDANGVVDKGAAVLDGLPVVDKVAPSSERVPERGQTTVEAVVAPVVAPVVRVSEPAAPVLAPVVRVMTPPATLVPVPEPAAPARPAPAATTVVAAGARLTVDAAPAAVALVRAASAALVRAVVETGVAAPLAAPIVEPALHRVRPVLEPLLRDGELVAPTVRPVASVLAPLMPRAPVLLPSADAGVSEPPASLVTPLVPTGERAVGRPFPITDTSAGATVRVAEAVRLAATRDGPAAASNSAPYFEPHPVRFPLAPDGGASPTPDGDFALALLATLLALAGAVRRPVGRLNAWLPRSLAFAPVVPPA